MWKNIFKTSFMIEGNRRMIEKMKKWKNIRLFYDCKW